MVMADKDQVVEMDTASLMEPLGKAFLELQGHKDATENNVEWSEIQEYFCQLETKMKKKFEEFEAREEEFKEKKSETSKMLAEREGAVAAKEQDLLDRIQELKDAAVEAIAEARATHQPEALEPIDGGDNKETKVSNSTTSIIDAPEEKNKTGENAEVVADEVKPRPELTQFCEQMDAKGLLNYTMENQKNIPALGSELSVALKSATDPAHLVLASLEGFYPLNDTTQGDKHNAALKGMRQSCLMFMEAMTNLLARSDQGADHLLNPEIKQQAKAIADEWKLKWDAANGNSLEAEAFLQLLATFRIVSEFDEEELCKLVLAVAHQRRAPELCRSLELTHKMPGVVEALVNSGKQVDAVHFIYAFQLTESFSPVSLLKTNLKDLRRNSQGKPGNSGNVAGTQNDANAQELEALKAVIQCVQEFKLQADYPLDPLLKRVSQLENLKSDKKRSKDFGKRQQHKKPRVNGGGVYGSRPRGGAPPAAAAGGRQGLLGFGQRPMYAGGIPERNSHSGMSSYDYQAPSQSIYQQTYGQRSYYYPPQEDRVSASAYNTAPPSYGSGMQPSHQQYM